MLLRRGRIDIVVGHPLEIVVMKVKVGVPTQKFSINVTGMMHFQDLPKRRSFLAKQVTLEGRKQCSVAFFPPLLSLLPPTEGVFFQE